MSKRNTRKRNKSHGETSKNKEKQVFVSCNASIDYDKLADAIVVANSRIQYLEKEEREKKEQEEKEEWEKVLHIIKIPEKSSFLKKIIINILNDLIMTWNILFFKKQNAKKPRVTLNILRLLLEMIFGIFRWGLIIIAIVLVYGIATKRMSIVNISFVFLSVCFASIARIAEQEIDNIKDESLLTSIFSTITSFIAMVVALTTLVIQIM